MDHIDGIALAKTKSQTSIQKGTKMQKIDLRGAISPFTLLKISNAFRTLEKGEVLEIFWGDRDLLNDLVKIIPESSYELIEMENLDQENWGTRIQLKKIRGSAH